MCPQGIQQADASRLKRGLMMSSADCFALWCLCQFLSTSGKWSGGWGCAYRSSFPLKRLAYSELTRILYWTLGGNFLNLLCTKCAQLWRQDEEVKTAVHRASSTSSLNQEVCKACQSFQELFCQMEQNFLFSLQNLNLVALDLKRDFIGETKNVFFFLLLPSSAVFPSGLFYVGCSIFVDIDCGGVCLHSNVMEPNDSSVMMLKAPKHTF